MTANVTPRPDPLVGQYAQRLLTSQDVQRGNLRGDGPPTPLQVAAVLHGLADHTAIVHLLDVIAAGRAMTRPGDDFRPEATSVGRYFHALAEHIERLDFDQRTLAPADAEPSMTQMLSEIRAHIATDPRLDPSKRGTFADAIDTLITGGRS